MSKATDVFRAAKVFNSHNFYGHGNVYITYTPNDYGRGGRSAYWAVCRPGFKTDAEAHWRDYGNKTFTLYRHQGTHAQRRAASLADAQAWAAERYGITEWAKDPYGSFGEAGFVKARIAELKNAVAA